MHTWQTALRGYAANWTCSNISAACMPGSRPCSSPTISISPRCRRAEPDQLRHHDAGRLVPQQPDASAYRRRRARPDRERHPRRVLPRLAETRAEAGRTAFLRSSASAPRGRAAAGRAPVPIATAWSRSALRSSARTIRRSMSRLHDFRLAREFGLIASMHQGGGPSQDARRLGEANRGRPCRPRHQHRPWQRPAG